MKDKLVVNSITKFDRYWSGNSRVTADLLSDLTVPFRGFFQRQITEQNSTHACLTGTIPNFIIFDKMKDKLVVNSITEFDRYWSGETAQCSESPIFRNLNIPKNSPPGKILKYFKWHKTHTAFRLHSRAETLNGLSRISLFLGNIC